MQHPLKLNGSGPPPIDSGLKLDRPNACRIDKLSIGKAYWGDIGSVCLEPVSVGCHVGGSTSVSIPEIRDR